MRILSCCWPGLSGVWRRGDARSLLTAGIFAAGLNCVLWLCFGVANPPAIAWQVSAWLLLASLWLTFCWQDYRHLALPANPTADAELEGLFIRAQAEYLKGHWFEAEKLAQAIVKTAPDDVEAQILLASIYRRMKRIDEARSRLVAVDRLNRAETWELELTAERRLLDTLEQADHESSSNPAAEDEPPAAMTKAA